MKAYFVWNECRPNLTEYQQTSVILNPQQFVIGVEVPDKAEYLVNFIEVNNAILNGQDIPSHRPVMKRNSNSFINVSPPNLCRRTL